MSKNRKLYLAVAGAVLFSAASAMSAWATATTAPSRLCNQTCLRNCLAGCTTAVCETRCYRNCGCVIP